MKNKIKQLGIAFVLVMLGNFYVNAQNHLWTLPPYSIYEYQPPSSLPTPIPYMVDLTYNGEVAHHAHNAIAKPNGDLAFFVIDDRVYDDDGDILYIFDHSGDNVSGNSEICIVPDPASCGERFYIFTSNSWIDGAFYYPYGSILDLEAPSAIYPDSVELTGGPAFGGFDSDNIKQMNELAPFENSDGILEDFNNNHDHPYLFAASPKLDDDSYLVMFTEGAGLFRMRIDETGMHPINPPIIIGDIVPNYGSNNNGRRSELELIQLDSLTFRVGVSSTSSGSGTVVAAFDVDLNGNYIGGYAFAHELTEPSSDKPHIKGLEFSKNGRYLYFTHHESPNNPDAVQYLDLDLSTVNTLNVPNDGDFQYSQIELGIDDRLYFAYANGLAALADSDDPNSTWTAPFVSLSMNLSNAGAPLEEHRYSYLLPDQMDGMDYSDIFDYPYHSVSVSGIETWTPDDNPFSNDTSLVRIKEELRIESGAHITIQNMRFEFFEDARVVIEPGARLTMDSTTFTVGPCGAKMWLGVEVHGDPEASQLPVSNQGYLNMINNSVIEHAYIGALAASRYQTNQVSNFSNGGIIRAFNSRFRNNMTDVWIHNYDWNGEPNHCHFVNCDFLTDALLNDPEVLPSSHAYLRRVNDVRFRSCSFRNTASFADLPIDNRGTGVFSYNAIFRVIGDNETYEAEHDTLPISDNVHQSFYRLRYGAKVVGQPNHHFTVSKMEFQDNKTGIYVLGASYETITLNNFKVPEIDDNYPGFNYGAYLINSYLFTIEENNFFGGPELTRIAGLVIDNSCPDDAEGDKNIELENEVYRNQFTDLEIGILVENDNRDQNSEVGLQARCNQFPNNYSADIFLADYSEWRKNQGELSPPEAASNNLFSQSTFNCAGLYSDVKVSPLYGANQSPNSLTIDYRTLETPTATQPYKHYQNPISGCQEQKLWLVETPGDLDYETHCPSNFSTGGGIKVPMAELVQQLATAEANLESARAVYQATIDGGDTEDIIALLQNLLDEESAYLRDLLLASYPLSRKALMAALDAADSFDPWHLTQVLVANAPLAGDVYSFVKDNQILSPFFFQFVEDAQANGGVNLGRLLYSEISLRSYEKSQAERGIHRHYLHHSDSLDAAAWNTYLESRDEPYYRLYRLGAHLDNGETGAAQTMLDSLKLNVDSKDWFQFMIDLEVADTVTAADINSGWDFFYNAPAARGNVWGWLTAQGQLDSIPPMPPIAQPRSFSLMSDEESAKADRWLEAYPNPAKDRVVLTYPHEADGIGTVQLFNADGRLMKTFAASNSGFEEININGWPTGVYIAKLFVNDKAIDTVKISVVK